VLVVEHGMGGKAVEAALAWLLEGGSRPRAILCAGFAGGLRAGLAVGELVCADEVVDTQGGCWPTNWPGAEGFPWHRGRVLTSQQLVGRPEDKRLLADEYNALAVDMESAVVARVCQRYEVPFACLRVISDDWETPLSDELAALITDGTASPAGLAWALLRKPGMVGELLRLARHTRRAAGKLAEGVEALLGAA
jgi:adenosylhomocysteine nucleosidase